MDFFAACHDNVLMMTNNRGHFITNPNEALLRGNPSKLPYQYVYLHCLLTLKWVMIPEQSTGNHPHLSFWCSETPGKEALSKRSVTLSRTCVW